MPLGFRTNLIVLICMAGLIFLAGCESARVAQLKDPRDTGFDRSDLIEALDKMDQRRAKVTTVIARLEVVLKDKTKDKEYGLGGAYLGDDQGNVRLQIRHGETPILDLAFRGQEVDVWLPRKDKFFSGEKRALIESNASELSLLAHVGHAHDLFFPRAWTPQAVARRRCFEKEEGREVVDVLERPGVTLREVRRFFISKSLPVADQVDVILHDGKKLGSVNYENYRLPPPTAGSAEDGQIKLTYPSRLTLSTPTGKRDLQLDVVEMLINEPIPVERFKIEPGEGAPIINLGETLRSGKELWE